MFLKVLISTGILTFILGHVCATGCYELQKSQLNYLNERMHQMIDTISSLLPKSLKKLTPAAPLKSTRSHDYIPNTTGPEMSYYNPPTYSPSHPLPHVMYIPPSYIPLTTAVAVTPPKHPNPIEIPQAPQYYRQAETEPHPEYSTVTPFGDSPGLYPVIQFPHPPEFAYPYHPNVPSYAPGLPLVPLPVQFPPGAYTPAYTQMYDTPQLYM